MDDRALTAGIAFDGLRSRREIRILVCFIVSKFDDPLSRIDLLTIIQREGLANYMEACDAIEFMIEKGNLIEDKESLTLSVTESGQIIADSLYTSLPFTVREKALAVGLQIISRRRSERQNKVELVPVANGFLVQCSIMEGDTVMMSTSLYVPNEHYAKVVRERFLNDPETLYRLVLSQLTDTVPIDIQ